MTASEIGKHLALQSGRSAVQSYVAEGSRQSSSRDLELLFCSRMRTSAALSASERLVLCGKSGG